jgi:hypothetical protein
MALNAIFLTLTALGFIPLAENVIQAAKGPQYLVTVGIGQGLKESDSLGGNVPGVSLWTARGEAIGGAPGSGKILPDATPVDISVSGNKTLGNGEAPVEYISVTNGGDDAICVAYVSVSEPGAQGTKRLFFGETGYSCQADWYPSILTVGQTAKPKCIWIDRNGSNGLRFQGMGIHMPSFSNSGDATQQGLATEYQKNIDTMCKSGPRFRMYPSINTEDPILFFDPPFTEDDFNPDGSDKDPAKIINNPGKLTNINMDLANKACESTGCPHIIHQIDQNPSTNKRQVEKRQPQPAWDSNQLVVSSFPEHSAEEVCKSEFSRGPDFLSKHEMKYCDMDTKMLWDVCSSASATCCYDVDVHSMRPCGYRIGTAQRTDVPNKKYTKIRQWGS